MSEHEQPQPSDAAAPTAPTSGDPRVDAAVEPLDSLDDVPVHEHPAVVENVHRNLQDILAEEQE